MSKAHSSCRKQKGYKIFISLAQTGETLTSLAIVLSNVEGELQNDKVKNIRSHTHSNCTATIRSAGNFYEVPVQATGLQAERGLLNYSKMMLCSRVDHHTF